MRAKVVVFGQSGFIWGKLVVFRQSGCFRAKVVVFGKKLLYSGKVVLLGEKWLYLGRVVVFGLKWFRANGDCNVTESFSNEGPDQAPQGKRLAPETMLRTQRSRRIS